MSDAYAIALLIGLGLILAMIEIIFIPGTTVVGIMGALVAGYGIYLAFAEYGNITGWLVLGGTMVILILLTIYALRSGTWEKLTLKSSINSHVNEEREQPELKVGQTGQTISALRPSGKAEFNEEIYEVVSFGQYISSGQTVKIIQVKPGKIIVEPFSSSNTG